MPKVKWKKGGRGDTDKKEAVKRGLSDIQGRK